jgi:23S rRNA (cytidine2498-2'-O)-methyltransferase
MLSLAGEFVEERVVAYLAIEGFENELREELGSTITAEYGRLFLAKQSQSTPIWIQNIWHQPQIIEFKSVSEGAKKLKDIQRNWAYFSHRNHRRAELIEKQLPHVSSKPIRFLSELPEAPLGSWTLIEPQKILASPSCSSPFANGDVKFIEDKESPPSRAYLKLWELFTVHKIKPSAGERCVDFGSSPGGWTWVLQQLGVDVVSIDKAALDPRVANLSRVEVLKKDAFTIKPDEIGPIDWFFSDIICYPQKLLELVQLWKASGLVKNFVCTIKFKGETDHEIVQQFVKIPNSKIIHLFHNKHELTWICLSRL